ncbi:wax ester/triacylglycerol synthase domain-containing protein [Blastococcus sp. SYSU D00820]
MPPQDSLWLELDRPEHLMTITSVLWTEEPVDPDRLREVVAERLVGRFPVFSQRPVLHGGVVRTASWEDDPDFDLDRHVVVRDVPAPGDRAALQAYVAALRGEPIDRAHPLWTIHLLQGYRGGSAVVQRYHHAMADGVRLVQVMLGILEPVAEDTGLAATVGRSGPGRAGLDPVGALTGLARRLGAGPLVDAAASVTGLLPRGLRPEKVAGAGADAGLAALNTAGSLTKLALWTNPENALATAPPGTGKTAAWGEPVPLRVLQDLARASGGTVNDVCLTLVAGAVHRYLADHPTPGKRWDVADRDQDLAWMVPVNLEPAGAEPPPELGNHFALVLAVLPHGPAGFPARLREVRRRVLRIRNSWEPVITAGLAGVLARSPSPVGPAATELLADKAVGVLTNVPGPRGRMALAGATVAGVVGWAPCSGRQAVTACVFSYAGEVTVGFGTDRGVVPDPERLVEAFDAELAGALESVPAASRPERVAATR